MTTRSICTALLTLPLAAIPARASEVTVKNDSFESGGSAYIVGDFIPGEQAGARLTAPCNGVIVAVQIAWLEGTPGHPADIQQAIHIYEGSTFPKPGPELALLEAPLLTPGYINEFRYLDEEQTIPLHVPVVTGQKFYVTLEFATATDVGGGAPSVIRDVDGCQSGKNVLYAIPGGWIDFCVYLKGDLVIRAVIDCTEQTGACCLPDGSCAQKTQAQCTAAGGSYKGDGVSCAGVFCPQPKEACCFKSTGGCLDLTVQDCLTAGGKPGGPGTKCATHVCFPVGACCLPDGTCQDGLSPEECAALNGTFQGDKTTCATVDCPDPAGACCFSTGGCLMLVAADCAIAGGTWKGAGTDCVDGNGDGKPDDCQPSFSAGDLNCDGKINAFDIDPFVLALTDPAAYEAAYPACDVQLADVNADGKIDAFDIDPFVALLVG